MSFVTMIMSLTLTTSRVNTLFRRTIRIFRLSRTIPRRDSFFCIVFLAIFRTPIHFPIAWLLSSQFGTRVTSALLRFSCLSFLTRVLRRSARVFPSRFSADLFTLDLAATPCNLLRTRAVVFGSLVFAFRSLRLILLAISGFFRFRSVAGK